MTTSPKGNAQPAVDRKNAERQPRTRSGLRREIDLSEPYEKGLAAALSLRRINRHGKADTRPALRAVSRLICYHPLFRRSCLPDWPRAACHTVKTCRTGTDRPRSQRCERRLLCFKDTAAMKSQLCAIPSAKWKSIFGILLSPMIAGAAISLSSVSVIGNALRLRTFDLA
jgi:hypothetical protein